MTRVDYDEPHTALQCGDDGGCVGYAGEAGVVAPKDQHAAAGDIRHSPAAAGADTANAISVAGGEGTPPPAEVQGDVPIGRAEGVREPLDETIGIGDRCRRRRGKGKGNGLRAVLLSDAAHCGRSQVEGLIPADALPAGVWIALGPRPAKGVGEPLGMRYEFRRRPTLRADCLSRGV
jgi:hypothetical protein